MQDASIERVFPVEEMLADNEFTDRVEILRELDGWVKNIQKMASSSTAIIAPRRMGKTVLLDRLVNTVFFKPEYKVAPFYFRMKREETTLRNFLLEYATTFFRQYIAYCLQDPILYNDQRVNIEHLIKYPSEHDAIVMAKEYIKGFLGRFSDKSYDDIRNQWDGFIKVPEQLASYSGIRVAIIIDEFQDMKFYIHNVDEASLKQIREERIKKPYLEGTDLTATYDRQSQSRKAPMLVSGSAVTLIFRTVMGGPLGGRFDFSYLKPLSIPDGAALLRQLLEIYQPDSEIDSENALYASTQVTGHPYYLYCLAMSKCENKSYNSIENIDRIIRFEIERGKIYGFWQTHFEENRRVINNDGNPDSDNDIDEAIGRKIIYYFTKYNNKPVEINEIADKLNISKKKVEKKIEKLHQADLVYRSAARFYTFNDICLMRFIKFVYEKDIEDIEKLEDIDLSQQGLFNTLKGKFLEMVVQVTMMKFNNCVVDGKFFGKKTQIEHPWPDRISATPEHENGEGYFHSKDKMIELPLFQYVDSKTVKSARTRQYQIDVYARAKSLGKDKVWICECKYTKTKMGMRQVQKIEGAAKALKMEAEEEGVPVPDVVIWLVSTGGFTNEVLDYIKDRDDILYSDHEAIDGIFKFYGGNYSIPIFHDA